MNIVEIKFSSTSDKTANATAMIIRENKIYRILYFPKLVTNDKNPDECVEGSIICQKKSKNDKWENKNEISLKDIKINELGKLDINLGEMLNLIRYSEELKKIYDSDKSIKRVKQKHVIVLPDELNQDEIDEFNQYAKSNPHIIGNLKKILSTDIDGNSLVDVIKNNPKLINDIGQNLDSFNSEKLYNELKLKLINPEYLKRELENSNEEFWQTMFNNNPNILFNIIPSAGQIISSKPYMGGKLFDNKGGTLADFLVKAGTRNICIIEIKTPVTKLIDEDYRNNVFSPSKELSSAVVQIRKQKDSLLKNYYTLKGESESNEFFAYDPKSYLIIGNTSNMPPKKIESFELFRNSLKDVEIITFNEVIKKLSLIYDNLSIEKED